MKLTDATAHGDADQDANENTDEDVQDDVYEDPDERTDADVKIYINYSQLRMYMRIFVRTLIILNNFSHNFQVQVPL